MYDLNNWAARGSCGVREWPRVCRRGTWEERMHEPHEHVVYGSTVLSDWFWLDSARLYMERGASCHMPSRVPDVGGVAVGLSAAGLGRPRARRRYRSRRPGLRALDKLSLKLYKNGGVVVLQHMVTQSITRESDIVGGGPEGPRSAEGAQTAVAPAREDRRARYVPNPL